MLNFHLLFTFSTEHHHPGGAALRKQRCLAAGFSGFFSKPIVDPDLFHGVIQKILGTKKN
jgi:hypothetical protein